MVKLNPINETRIGERALDYNDRLAVALRAKDDRSMASKIIEVYGLEGQDAKDLPMVLDNALAYIEQRIFPMVNDPIVMAYSILTMGMAIGAGIRDK